MARILPNSPLGFIAPETIRVHHLLKRLPDEDYVVWQKLTWRRESGPDFWLLRRDRRAMLLKVSGATTAGVQAILKPGLFDAGQAEPLPGHAEQATMEQFLSHLGAIASKPIEIATAVLFPNLPHSILEQLRPIASTTVAWLPKETLTPRDLAAWLDEHLGPPLSAAAVSVLRRAFTPEVVVPSSFTVRGPIDRNSAARLTNYLLDYRQEHILKIDLDLSVEAQKTAREFQLRLINGVAGSGKSLIVVYRAHLWRQLFPNKEILVLTHNRPLIRDLAGRYQQLSDGDRSVRFNTFLGWCRKYWPNNLPWKKLVKLRQRQEILGQAWYKHLADTAVSTTMLQEEIDWYKDRPLFGRANYLTADRSGRGFALAESMRHRVYDAMDTYHKLMSDRALSDWTDVPRQLWWSIIHQEADLPLYDAILIDEAQFFAPIWFEIIKSVLKPASGQLFLVADPSQGFLKRRQSWLASGLEVRGRSHRLDKSYRTTREILDFATLLYRTRLPQDEEHDEIVAPNLLDMPNGALPVVIPLTSKQDEMTRVVNEIRRLVDAGVPLAHILVIHANWRETGALIARLQRAIGVAAAADPGQRTGNDFIRVCSLNAATGLESPIVFLMGVHALYEEEQSIRLSEGERAELIRDNTRKLYMAITRAGQRLVLTYVGQVPDVLSGLIVHE